MISNRSAHKRSNGAMLAIAGTLCFGLILSGCTSNPGEQSNQTPTDDRNNYYIYSATLGTEAPSKYKASGETRFSEAQGVCKRGSWKPSKSVPTVQDFRRVGYDEKEIVVLS